VPHALPILFLIWTPCSAKVQKVELYLCSRAVFMACSRVNFSFLTNRK
jgi:hypothetical protein